MGYPSVKKSSETERNSSTEENVAEAAGSVSQQPNILNPVYGAKSEGEETFHKRIYKKIWTSLCLCPTLLCEVVMYMIKKIKGRDSSQEMDAEDSYRNSSQEMDAEDSYRILRNSSQEMDAEDSYRIRNGIQRQEIKRNIKLEHIRSSIVDIKNSSVVEQAKHRLKGNPDFQVMKVETYFKKLLDKDVLVSDSVIYYMFNHGVEKYLNGLIPYYPSASTIIELLKTVIYSLSNCYGKLFTKKGARTTKKGESKRKLITVAVLKIAAAAAGKDVGRLFNGRPQDDHVLTYITVYPDDIRMRIDIPTTLYSDLHQIDQCSSLSDKQKH